MILLSALKVRAEPFGCWIRLPDHTLVAVDRARARTLGIDGGARWDDAIPQPVSGPLEVHVAVTSRCPVGCVGCYQNATADGKDVPLDALRETLDGLRDLGVFTVAFGGGEPLLHPALASLAQEACARGLTPVVTTSGVGLTAERLEALRGFAQVNVSHDGVAGGYLAVRGVDGAALADRAVRALVSQGTPVGVNHVLTRENFPQLAQLAEHVRRLGARELQLLRYKPAGRAADGDYTARRLTPDQVDALGPTLTALARAHQGALSLRVDCALVPLLSGALSDPEALSRFGVLGCEAGARLGAVGRDGALAGCSFVAPPGGEAPAPRRSLPVVWERAAAVEAFRAWADAPPEPCANCTLRGVCRGGCKAVALHLLGRWAPDPECPRVRAWART